MCYNGLNNVSLSLCQINNNHPFAGSSHTRKIKSYNYSKHHKNTLIDNKALSLFKMGDYEKVIGLTQKMKGIYDNLPSGRITKEAGRRIHKHFIDIALYANNKHDDRTMRRAYLSKEEEVSIKVVYFINNVAAHNNTAEIPQTVDGGHDLSHFNLKGIVIKDEDLSDSNLTGCRLQDTTFQDCNMYKTNFYYTIVEKVLFDDCTLDDSNFAQTRMVDGALNVCSVMHVQFHSVVMNRTNIENIFLDYLNFYIAYMAEVNLYKIIAPHVNLFKAGPSPSKPDLTNFKHADLSHVSLNKAVLQSIDLIDSKLFCMWLTNTLPEMVICADSSIANVNLNNINLSNHHLNCSILTEACMLNTRFYRVNLDEASVQGTGISVFRGEENIPIDSDALVTRQKLFEEDRAPYTDMSQTEDNINAVAMKITADITQHTDRS